MIKGANISFRRDNSPALLGRRRLGGDLAIAVDPQNDDSVYLVWGELLNGQPALHVIRSDQRRAEMVAHFIHRQECQ